MSNNHLLELRESDIYIFVKINGRPYAIGTKSVLEILKLVYIDTPESLPKHIVGIAEYNSSIINIADLRSILSLPTTPYTLENQIIIISGDEMVFGIIVDEVSDVKKIDMRFLQPAPYHTESTFAKAVYTEGEENTVFLSMTSVENAIKSSMLLKDKQEKNTFAGLLPDDPYSVEVLKERAEDLRKKIPTNYGLINENDQYISFLVDGTTYCVRIEYIKSFGKIERNKITKVPCTPDFVIGLLNIKGEYITIIDLKSYLGEGSVQIDEKSILITLNSGEFKLGFIADAIGESVNIQPEELEIQDTKNELSNYVKDEQLRYVLNIEQMLSNEKLYIR